MRFLHTPFIILTLSTIIGIILGLYITIDVTSALFSFLAAIIILAVSWQRSKKIYNSGWSFSLMMILTFVIFGIVLVRIHDPKHNSSHYLNQFSKEELQQNYHGIEFHIRERLKPTSFYQKYVVSITYLDHKMVQGKILLLIPKDSSYITLDIGNTYIAFTQIKPIPAPLNPHQFDYAKYLSKHYVYHQIKVSKNRLVHCPDKPQWSILRTANILRNYVNVRLPEYSFTAKQLSIINALLLGQRQDINHEIFNQYRDAGAIHILAVSGLHVGIILMMLNLILRPLDRYKKRGKAFKLILTLILLWCFASVAGLSPSVLRAVTMFSFMAIGQQIKSKTSIYTSLFVSLFVLLCFNPLLLFSVGFQLSYLAVFAIVWIQPILARRYTPTFYFSKKIWETLTVTLAAQLGLLPLTLYYFHQFPGLFFLSNLIIIPFLGGILGYGIIVIILAVIGILPQFMASLFGNCINLLNGIVAWISKQQDFVITEIPFSWRMLLTLYVVIITTIMIIQKYNRRSIFSLLTSIVVIMSVLLYEKYTVSNHEELIIFNNRRNTTVGVLENQKLRVYSHTKIPIRDQNFLFGNYSLMNHASYDTTPRILKNTYRYKEHTILVIDSASIYFVKTFQPDIIILSNSPKIHLDRIIDILCPLYVIADGSNYKSYLDRWEKSCRKHNTPFHRTDKNGAFILQ